MKSQKMNYSAVVIGLLVSIWVTSSYAQNSDNAASKDVSRGDKTGTNPINFSPELRLYNETLKLNTEGDGVQNITTLEGRISLLDEKFQLRVRARGVFLKADFDEDGVDEVDDSGFGDLDFRLLTVPYMSMAKKQALAVGLEVFLNTASEDTLGTGVTSLGPQVFYVKFLPTGLFAPGLQWKISVDEDTGRSEEDKILIDLNYLRMAKDKQSWFFADPQIVFDNENNTEYVILDVEIGVMMSKWTSLKGQSIYIRPSVGIGNDRPVDGSVEIGYKFVF
ncbi:MAG: hypothetical protein QNK24_16545 [Desulfuromusa sp.]|nr:hypothetical protein [Desulfuromusa sp.]